MICGSVLQLRFTFFIVMCKLCFRNDFIQILNFVRNVALKTSEEKAEFFRYSCLFPFAVLIPTSSSLSLFLFSSYESVM